MKIVCAALNSKFIHSTLSPWCLKSGVDCFCSEKHKAVVIEGTINSSLNAFCDKIINEKPEIVAFSCYIWNISQMLEAAEIIKNSTDCIICFGGPEVEYRSTDILSRFSFVDFVISGEGEWSFSAFVEAIHQGFDFSKVSGLTYRNDDIISANPVELYNETPPSPYCPEYFEGLNSRIAYIEAGRGCPYKCSYCLSGQLKGFRNFDFDRVCNDIIRLSQSGTKTVKFVDRTFNANKDFANRILNFIKDNYGQAISDKVCFHFEISADILFRDTMEILKAMPEGSCQLEIGIQSFNADTLKAINRKSDLKKLCDNTSELISSGNIHIHTDLIAGLPEEDIASFIDGFNRAFFLRSHMLQVGFLKVLHGADINNSLESFGCVFSSEPPYEVIRTDILSEEDISLIKLCEKATDKLCNSGRFIFTVDYLIEYLKISPFELLSDAGRLLNDNLSLSETVRRIYLYFKDKSNDDILREKLLCDIACSGVNIKLPDELYRYDPLYKTLKKKITEKLKKNVKIVVLYSENKVFTVSQDAVKDLYGRQGYNIFEIEEFIG